MVQRSDVRQPKVVNNLGDFNTSQFVKRICLMPHKLSVYQLLILRYNCIAKRDLIDQILRYKLYNNDSVKITEVVET